MKKVIIPKENPSDDEVHILDILVSNGEYVQKGTTLAILETSKTTFDLVTPAEGYFYLKPNLQTHISVGSLLGVVNEIEQDPKPEWFTLQDINSGPENVVKSQFSKKALKLIEKFGLKTKNFNHLKLVREKDVNEFLDGRTTKSAKRRKTANEIVIWGAGGFGKMCYDLIKNSSTYNIIGFIDDKPDEDYVYHGSKIIGSREKLNDVFNDGTQSICIAIGCINNNYMRNEFIEYADNIGFKFPNFIHKTSVVESSAIIGAGNLIFPHSYIGSQAELGNHCIVNVGSCVSHECVIEDGVHITPMAALAGMVKVGSYSLIGMASTIYLGVEINKYSIIPNGSHVLKDL